MCDEKPSYKSDKVAHDPALRDYRHNGVFKRKAIMWSQ